MCSNVLELQVDNPQLFRVVAYRLDEANQLDLAVCSHSLSNLTKHQFHLCRLKYSNVCCACDLTNLTRIAIWHSCWLNEQCWRSVRATETSRQLQNWNGTMVSLLCITR